MRKRLLSVMIVFCVMMGLVVPVNAKEVLPTEVQEVSGTETFTLERVLIGSRLKVGQSTYVVTGIKQEDDLEHSEFTVAFSGMGDIDAVEFRMPDTITVDGIDYKVTSILSNAMRMYSNLNSVVIPEGILSIGDKAFMGCSSLSGILIPASVIEIGEGVFSGCSALAEIGVSESNTVYASIDGVLYNKDKTRLLLCPNEKRGKLLIPSSVKSIASSAFGDSENLKDVYYEGGEEKWSEIEIGEGNECLNNAMIHYNSSMPSEDDSDQSEKPDTEMPNEPDTETPIPEKPTIGTKVKIGGYLYEVTGIKEENDSENTDYTVALISAENRESKSCFVPESIIVGGVHYKVTSIENGAFSGYSKMVKITIFNNVTSIGEYAFSGCSGLLEVIMSDNVESIGKGAFKGCTNLRKIIIPSGVTSIEAETFRECTRLNHIEVPESMKKIETSAFSDGYLKHVYYTGSEEKWSEIEIGDGNECLNCVVVHYNSSMPSEDDWDIVEGPDTEIFESETGESEIPGTETRESEMQGTEVEESETRGSEIDESETPRTETCESETLGTETRESETPETETRESETLGTETKESETSKTEIKESEISCTEVSGTETGASEDSWGETQNTETRESETSGSEATGDSADSGHMHTIVSDAAVLATCTATGKTEGSHCSSCGEIIKAQTVMPMTAHNYQIVMRKASPDADGSICKMCVVCGQMIDETAICAPAAIELSKDTYVYSGKAKKPAVVVKNSAGEIIDSGFYTVTYHGNKNVGYATAVITFKGNYQGTLEQTFTICPKAAKISKIVAGSKCFTVKWKKETIQTDGYEIQYSTGKKFSIKTDKTVVVGKNKTISQKIKKLKAKKKYYVRIRTYKTVKEGGKSIKIYSAWSKAKKVTTKN